VPQKRARELQVGDVITIHLRHEQFSESSYLTSVVINNQRLCAPLSKFRKRKPDGTKNSFKEIQEELCGTEDMEIIQFQGSRGERQLVGSPFRALNRKILFAQQKEDSYKVRVYKRSAGGLEATYDGCHVFIPWKYTFVQQANSEEEVVLLAV